MIARGEGVRELGETVEGIKKHRLVITKLSWDVNYSIENIVNNIVITMHGTRWVLEISEG